MLAFHAALSARGGGTFGEFHDFFTPDVDCKRKKVARAWACFAEAIDEEAREHVLQSSFELLLQLPRLLFLRQTWTHGRSGRKTFLSMPTAAKGITS